MDKTEVLLQKIRHALKERDIEMDTDYNEVTLKFPNGDFFRFKAEGPAGVNLIMDAEVKLSAKIRID